MMLMDMDFGEDYEAARTTWAALAKAKREGATINGAEGWEDNADFMSDINGFVKQITKLTADLDTAENGNVDSRDEL